VVANRPRATIRAVGTDLIFKTVSTSSESTEASRLRSRTPRAGAVDNPTVGDLTAETTFVRGCKGMEYKLGSLASFTRSQRYRSPKLTLYHFDFYRLNDPGIMANEAGQ